MSEPETFLDGRVTLHCGDSRDVLRAIPDASIHAVVTDPPYALVSIGKRFGKEGAAPALHGRDGAYARASAGFMGKQWDTGETAFAVEFWREVLRVLKPGGHIVAFSGTRTYHRMACAIEDAGFEIRDQLAWAYGSGFAKSHAVDLGLWKGVLSCQFKENAPLVVQLSAFTLLRSSEGKGHIVAAPALILPEGSPAVIIQTGKAEGSSAVTVMSVSESEQTTISLSTGWSWERSLVESSDPRNMFTIETSEKLITTPEIWKSLTSSITRESTPLNATLKNGWTWPAATVASGSSDGDMSKSDIPILTAHDDATWNPVARAKGIGSGLKPAWEPICMARKPLDGTVAANVLEHGTGALNIDGCRVGDDGGTAKGRSADKSQTDSVGGYLNAKAGAPIDKGRWPANIVHDGSPEVVDAFPSESGGGPPRKTKRSPDAGNRTGYGAFGGQEEVVIGYGDSGSAARFFYSAKADADDRLGSKHPTVKPVDLMQWLCRLVTPPGGTVLDPFAGTGTTGEAAWREGFFAVLVEREAEYQVDIRRRMKLALGGPDERKRESIKARHGDVEAGPLFSNLGAEE
jgi:DNA modification methylase